MTNALVLQRLLLITGIAGAIGYERERHGRAAGFRTHILVGVGSCLVMMTGLYLFEAFAGKVDVDPSRMAAQIVSGIGFLGAGTILRYGASVRGLTTAASLWAVAGVGIAVGAGFLSGAIMTGVLLIIVLFGLARLERAMRKEQYQVLLIDLPASSPRVLARIRKSLAQYNVEIRDLNVSEDATVGGVHLEFHVKMAFDQPREEIVQDLLRVEPGLRAQWQ